MTAAKESGGKYVDYLNFPPSSWKRPEGPPRIWRVVDGRRKTTDGKIPKFSIQEVPEGLEDEVVDFMIKYFITEEPTYLDLGFPEDHFALRELRTFWRDVLHQGVSIVALVVNSDPLATPVIAGVNILRISTAEDETESNGIMRGAMYRSKLMKESLELLFNLVKECDVLGKYGVDRYLGASGLSVHPSFRGQGLGEELLRARDDIGLFYQIPVSETMFTATASQILAARVGYEVLLERKYSEILNVHGEIAFPGVTVEFIKIMGKRLY